MKNLFTKLINSFDNENSGFSARKLTAFSLMVCVAYIHYKFIDTSTAINAQIVDLCAILVLLGIITIEQVIKLKNGNNNNENDK